MERENQCGFTEWKTAQTSDNCRQAFSRSASLGWMQVGSGATVLQQSIAEAVSAGGGEYRGIQRSPRTGIPDLVLFNDPATGTTLALIFNGRPITAGKVQAKIARSRARFASYGRYQF